MLEFFQAELEAIYGVEAPRVRDFLVRSGRPPEELLVMQQDGEVAIGLFLDDEGLAATSATDPHDRRPLLTGRGILGKLVCAAEGVSHFVYLATRAAMDRPVSLLELEVQAEVDKFAMLLLHLWR